MSARGDHDESATPGADSDSIEFIHAKILELREQGKTVLLVSSELTKIFNLSDCIYVIYQGTFSGKTHDQRRAWYADDRDDSRKGGALMKKSISHLIDFLSPVLLALALGYVSGYNLNQAFAYLLKGSLGSSAHLMMTLFAATPSIFTDLVTAISFNAGLYNMGAEGQLCLGVFFSPT